MLHFPAFMNSSANRKNWFELIREYPLGLLVAALLLAILCDPLLSGFNQWFAWLHGPARLLPFTVLLAAVSTYAAWSSAPERARKVFWISAAAVGLGIGSLTLHNSLIAAHLVMQTLFIGYVLSVIVRIVFSARIVDGNILCGAAAGYLLAGIFFGYVFAFIEFLSPGSFIVTESNLNLPQTDLIQAPGWLIYFSFTTLTTVAYGDIMPASSLARSVSVVEAVIGQIMLVVMIARLVGLHVAHTGLRPHQPVQFEVGNPKGKD